MPRVEKITKAMSKRLGTGTVVIPAPAEVEEMMRKIPAGKLATITDIRTALAKKHNATVGCPMTTGIFVRIVACVAEERKQNGEKTSHLIGAH